MTEAGGLRMFHSKMAYSLLSPFFPKVTFGGITASHLEISHLAQKSPDDSVGLKT